jgi:hypothetical protein
VGFSAAKAQTYLNQPKVAYSTAVVAGSRNGFQKWIAL